MCKAKENCYSYAHVITSDPLSGKLSHENVGYDGPDLPWVAQERAERIASENRNDPHVHDAYAVVEYVDERGEVYKSWEEPHEVWNMIDEMEG